MIDSAISDIWFRSDLSLENIVDLLHLSDPTFDHEDYWEWVIGRFHGIELDLTRTHTIAPDETDTRIFQPDLSRFSEPEAAELVDELRVFVNGTIYCGRWEYLSAQEFNKVVVSEHV